MNNFNTFSTALRAVIDRRDAACQRSGRSSEEVAIMAVTKTQGPWAAEFASQAGLEWVGENRVQEAAEKRPRCGAPISWALIGPLQSNKVKVAADLFDAVHSVDRIKIVNALDRHCADLGKAMPVCLQINAGDDPNKSGVSCADAPALLEAALAAKQISVRGLMTIAPLSDDPAVATRTFATLRDLRDQLERDFGLALPELSMGMTGDMEAAIEAGSTCIRIGSALFGARN